MCRRSRAARADRPIIAWWTAVSRLLASRHKASTPSTSGHAVGPNWLCSSSSPSDAGIALHHRRLAGPRATPEAHRCPIAVPPAASEVREGVGPRHHQPALRRVFGSRLTGALLDRHTHEERRVDKPRPGYQRLDPTVLTRVLSAKWYTFAPDLDEICRAQAQSRADGPVLVNFQQQGLLDSECFAPRNGVLVYRT